MRVCYLVQEGKGEPMKILEAIETFWNLHGYGPSFRDLQELTGISSTSVVWYQLRRLREQGVVDYEPDVARSVRLKKEER